MDLGLNNLTDDQLVELARSIASEVAKRNPAVADAAQAAIRNEINKARTSQDNLWAKKKWHAHLRGGPRRLQDQAQPRAARPDRRR